MKLDGFRQQFVNQHPETGELSAGSIVAAEQAHQLGMLFNSKVLSLSRKEELTQAEATFIDRVVDLGTRNVVVTVEQHGWKLPDSPDKTKTLMRSAYRLFEGARLPWPDGVHGESRDDVMQVLPRLTGSSLGVRTNPAARMASEDYAAAIMPYFADMVAENGDLVLSEYLAGNVQNLLAHFEMTEQATPVA